MIRISDIQAKKARGEKIVMLTAYNAWMARLLAAGPGVDILLVGDSVGMVELGYDTTLPVTMSDMVRHTRAVRAGAPEALIVADLPFLSHQLGITQALRNAGRLMQSGGASAVKLEGGGPAAATVEHIVSAGIPVMGHLGLLPQSVHQQGGFRRQATSPEAHRQLVSDAIALEDAGAFAIVIECVPRSAASEVTSKLRIPIIGIGSGPDCDGQVLVTHDILGLSGAAKPPFAKRYTDVAQTISEAVKCFSKEVHSGAFPDA